MLAAFDEQGGLFDAPTGPMAGRTDPQTSRDAAARMVDLRKLAPARYAALSLVRLHPGLNAKELGAIAAECDPERRDAEWFRQAIGRRLPELEALGLIERCGVRDGCTTWRVR